MCVQVNTAPAARFPVQLELLEPADLKPWMCALSHEMAGCCSSAGCSDEYWKREFAVWVAQIVECHSVLTETEVSFDERAALPWTLLKVPLP